MPAPSFPEASVVRAISSIPARPIPEKTTARTSSAGNKIYVFLNGAFNLQIKRWGFGVTADLQQYSLKRPGQQSDPKNELTAQIMQNHLLAAYSFLDDQLVIGVGARVVTLDVSTRQTILANGDDSLNTTGVGFETRLHLAPDRRARAHRLGPAHGRHR